MFHSEVADKTKHIFCVQKIFKQNLYYLHIWTVHQWRLKHFIIQQMHKYIIC